MDPVISAARLMSPRGISGSVVATGVSLSRVHRAARRASARKPPTRSERNGVMRSLGRRRFNATMTERSVRVAGFAADARMSPRPTAATPPAPSGGRRESFPPPAGEVASIQTNAPMDSAEPPSGIVVGRTQHPAVKRGSTRPAYSEGSPQLLGGDSRRRRRDHGLVCTPNDLPALRHVGA